MGWLYGDLFLGYNSREAQRLKDEYLRAGCHLTSTDPANSNVILKSAFVGSTWYAAMQVNRAGLPSRVVALVFLTAMGTRRKRGDYFAEFGYKDMDESVGPNECKCPMGIFNLLTPLEEGENHARAWREEVLAYHASRNQLKRKKESAIGRHVKLAQPVRYKNDDVVSEGKVVALRTSGRRRRNQLGLFSNGKYYKLPLHVLNAATLVLPEAAAG